MRSEFPWARLRSLIIEKLNEIGVPVEIAASDAVAEKTPQLLADE